MLLASANNSNASLSLEPLPEYYNPIPNYHPFDLVLPEIVETIMHSISDKDLFTITKTSKTNYKFWELAKKVKRFRIETTLIKICKTYIQGCSEDTTEFQKLFETCGKLSGSAERIKAMRNLFLSLCGKRDHVWLKNKFLARYPISYEYKALIQELFKQVEPNSYRLTTLVHPGSLDAVMQERDRLERKYTLAYLNALKAGSIASNQLTLEIRGPIDKKLVSRFAAAICNNASVQKMKLDIYDFSDLILLKDMLQAVNDNPYINEVELSLQFWYGQPLTKSFDEWVGVSKQQGFYSDQRIYYETLLKDHLNGFNGIKLDGDYLGPRLTCSLSKIITLDEVVGT